MLPKRFLEVKRGDLTSTVKHERERTNEIQKGNP
jgi:hypothetical protein